MLFWLTLGHFLCSVVTSVTFSSNLWNFEKNPKNPKKIFKNPKISKKKNFKIQKNPKKKHKEPQTFQNVSKNPKIPKISKNYIFFLQKSKSLEKYLLKQKKNPLPFSILGLRDLTRTLQFSLILRKNLEKSGKISKNHYFFLNMKFLKKKKNLATKKAILLVFQY